MTCQGYDWDHGSNKRGLLRAWEAKVSAMLRCTFGREVIFENVSVWATMKHEGLASRPSLLPMSHRLEPSQLLGAGEDSGEITCRTSTRR